MGEPPLEIVAYSSGPVFPFHLKQNTSGHDIAEAFGKDNGGAIPSNLLQIPNTESNSHYLRFCKMLERDSHPARFPADLPRFFIQFLTDPGDIVLDIFSGSNTTGFVAQQLQRRWLSMELEKAYAALSAVRFMDGWTENNVRSCLATIDAGTPINISPTLLGSTSDEPADQESNARHTDAPGQAFLFPT